MCVRKSECVVCYPSIACMLIVVFFEFCTFLHCIHVLLLIGIQRLHSVFTNHVNTRYIPHPILRTPLPIQERISLGIYVPPGHISLKTLIVSCVGGTKDIRTFPRTHITKNPSQLKGFLVICVWGKVYPEGYVFGGMRFPEEHISL